MDYCTVRIAAVEGPAKTLVMGRASVEAIYVPAAVPVAPDDPFFSLQSFTAGPIPLAFEAAALEIAEEKESHDRAAE